MSERENRKMVLTAKFASFCKVCNRRVRVGEKIEWVKGNPVRHAVCEAAPPAAAHVRHTSRRAPVSADDMGTDSIEYSNEDCF
jgi:hypothetical protein